MHNNYSKYKCKNLLIQDPSETSALEYTMTNFNFKCSKEKIVFKFFNITNA